MANPVLASNAPTLGSISWTNFGMVYLGKSYAFPEGHTTAKYVYWLFNGGSGSGLMTTDDPLVVSVLTDDDCLLFLNHGGFAINAVTTAMTYGDLIVPGTILTQNLAAHAITTQTMTVTANHSLIPNGSFDEPDRVNPAVPAFWTQGAGDGSMALDSIPANQKSPGGSALRMTQTIRAALSNSSFAANISGWSSDANATISWQSGWSASGQMKIALPASANTATLTGPSFAVTPMKTYNLLVAMEADGTGATPTAPVKVSLQIQWRDLFGTVISTSSVDSGDETQVTTAVDAFNTLQQEFTAPLGATTGKVLLAIPADPTQDSLHYLDFVQVAQSTFYQQWSDATPVSSGEWVRMTVWARADVATTDTRTTQVIFGPDANTTPATATVLLDNVVTPVYPAPDPNNLPPHGFNTGWTKYSGSLQIPDGVSFMRVILGTEPGTYATVGTYNVYFDDVNIEDVSSGDIQSSDYVPGKSGWSLQDAGGTSQVESLGVLGALGADTISANAIQLGADDLATRLDQTAGGVVAYIDAATGVDTEYIGPVPFTDSVILFTWQMANLQPGHRYVVLGRGHLQTTGVMPVEMDLNIHYDTNGVPITDTARGNNILDGSLTHKVLSANEDFFLTGFFVPDATWADSVPFSLSMAKTAGAASAGARISMANPNRAFQIIVMDMGTSNYVSSFAQKSKAGGAAPDVDQPTTHTLHFYPNESRTYDFDGTRRTGGETSPDMGQGRISATHGNTMSCAVYDWSRIQAALKADAQHPSGATNITVQLTFRVKQATASTGLNVSIHQHPYSGDHTPSVYRPGAEIATKTRCKEGSTYTITLPSSFGLALKAGTVKGIGFGKPATTSTAWFGYMYGAGSGSAPELTVSYTK